MSNKISILGAGNIGIAIAKGLIRSGAYEPEKIILSRRNKEYLKKLAKDGFNVTGNNANAVKFSKTLIVCVGPQQLKNLLRNIRKLLTNDYLIISVVSGISIKELKNQLPKKINVNVVSWRSAKLRRVTRSTFSSELFAFGDAVDRAFFLKDICI